jgi:nicotinate-nucleotide pyrophosphorylase (carboxylating)
MERGRLARRAFNMNWDSPEILSIIDAALKEDIGAGDITSDTLGAATHEASAVFLAKEAGVVAGLPLAERIFRRIDESCRMNALVEDGHMITAGSLIAEISGNAKTLLSGERLALNFLQRLSGIATLTAQFVSIAAPYGIVVLDTRKTTPLLRRLEKYAVSAGGGKNHRFGLFDAVLVKDNHLRLEPDFSEILRKFQSRGFPPDRVEIEVTTPEMLRDAMDAGGLSFLLDNMSPSMIQECVNIKREGVYFEVSGGIHPGNFSEYMIRGIDAISIGALTHSVKSLDISMEIDVA